MNEKTRKITTGAMFTAIFSALMLINRQTGEIFAELIYFLLPIPMVGYASKYGFKSGLIAMFAMTFLSAFVSTPTAIFYAFSESLIGLILGSGIHDQKPTGRLMLITMVLSVASTIGNLLLTAAISGITVQSEAAQMLEIMQDTIAKFGLPAETAAIYESTLNIRAISQILVISTILSGIVQGFIVFQLSLLILRRLKFHVPKPQSVFLFYPPRWTGFLCVGLYVAYIWAQGRDLGGIWPDVLQIAAIASSMYLMILGSIAGILAVRKYISPKPVIAAGIVILGIFMFSMLMVILGFVYTDSNLHDNLMPENIKPKREEA